ncbi:MAG: hypothetical protein ACTHQM_24730 [Thermoanaerobaculia bacterium]
MTHPLRLVLYNGSHTLDAWDPNSPAFIDDWKPKNRVIECDAVVMTYRAHLRVFRDDVDTEYEFTSDGILFVDGIYYGDFSIEPATTTPDAEDVERGTFTKQELRDVSDALDAAIEDHGHYARSGLIPIDADRDPDYASRLNERAKRWSSLLLRINDNREGITPAMSQFTDSR